ncbi:MAG: hypothetical protein V1676_07565 [Candidatus Diapherotrites archaeon]
MTIGGNCDSAVFIDGGFFDHVLDDAAPPKLNPKNPERGEFFRLDYNLFAEKLCELCGAKRLRTYYYHCRPIDDGSGYARAKNNFYNGLIRTPRFEFREGKLSRHRLLCKSKSCQQPLVCKVCGREQWKIEQKRTDDLLMVDVVSLSWRYLIKKAILVGGDSDFVPAFKESKEAGVIAYLANYVSRNPNSKVRVHDELYDLFDERIEITPEFIISCGKYVKRADAPGG